MATVLREWGFTGKFHLFDSFEGLSDLSSLDINERQTMSNQQVQEQKYSFLCSEETVRANLSEFDFIEYFPGWIPDRFPEVRDSAYILAHVEVDLYQPNRDSIEFLYPRLVDGGILAFADYGATQFPGVKKAVDEALPRLEPSHFYKIPTGGAFLIK